MLFVNTVPVTYSLYDKKKNISKLQEMYQEVK